MHQHGTAGARHYHRLRAAFALTGGFLLVEAAAGLRTGSLALLADAAHMLVDTGALALSLLAVRFAERPATPAKTYGYYRAEILAALVNGVVLCVVALGILVKGVRAGVGPARRCPGGPVLVVAVLGLLVNLAGMWLLHRGAGESLNVRSAYLELLGDAASSVAVIVAAIVILRTGWHLADPVASAAVAALILPRTWALLSRAVNVLMEGAPPHLDVGEIEAAMAGGARRPTGPRPARVDADVGPRGHERARGGRAGRGGGPACSRRCTSCCTPASASTTRPSRSRPSRR